MFMYSLQEDNSKHTDKEYSTRRIPPLPLSLFSCKRLLRTLSNMYHINSCLSLRQVTVSTLHALQLEVPTLQGRKVYSTYGVNEWIH